MIGPGRYDDVCTQARLATEAEGVILIVINGRLGSGFSGQLAPHLQAALPEMLEAVAADIRAGRE